MTGALDVVERSYLDWLVEQDTRQRIDNYSRYEDYYDGDQAAEIPEKIRQALESDLGFVGNYCRRVVDIPTAFLSGSDLSLEVTFSDDLHKEIEDEEQKETALAVAEKRATEAERFLYQVYRDSSLLRRNLIKLLRIQSKKGEVALKVALTGDRDAAGALIRNDNLRIRIKVLRPDIVFPQWDPEDYEVMTSCAIKYPRVNPETNEPEVYAQVWWPDQVAEYVARGEDPTDPTLMWRKVSDAPNPWGVIPIVWVKNREDEKPWGTSDLHDIIPLQDALNKTLTDLMVNADFQAFQRAFVIGTTRQKDDEVNTGPGTLTWIGQDSVNVQVIDPASPQGLLDILREIIDQISSLSGIPKRLFNRDDSGTGQLSGVALRIAFLTIIDVCAEKSALVQDALEWVNWIVFKAAAVEKIASEDYTDLETTVRLEEGLPIDDRERTEIAVKQVDARLKSRETAMKDLGVEDVETELGRIRDEAAETEDEFTRRALKDLEGGEEIEL